MIEIDGGAQNGRISTAVDGLSFVVEPGVVTGFLGPNGAGKSTTLEEAFFDLTRDETDYHATQLTGVTTGL